MPNPLTKAAGLGPSDTVKHGESPPYARFLV